eukprot:gene928-17949_t
MSVCDPPTTEVCGGWSVCEGPRIVGALGLLHPHNCPPTFDALLLRVLGTGLLLGAAAGAPAHDPHQLRVWCVEGRIDDAVEA